MVLLQQITLIYPSPYSPRRRCGGRNLESIFEYKILSTAIVHGYSDAKLMKTNLAADLAHISQIFSQVPTTFGVQSPHFDQGDCLLVGKKMRNPTFGGFEGRFSEEGVTDVPTSWATLEKGSG